MWISFNKLQPKTGYWLPNVFEIWPICAFISALPGYSRGGAVELTAEPGMTGERFFKTIRGLDLFYLDRSVRYVCAM